MNIPILLHGTLPEVRKRCSHALRQLLRGRDYFEVLGPTRDASSLSGSFIIQGSRGAFGNVAHVHCHLLSHEIRKIDTAKGISKQLLDYIVQASLSSAGTMTTLLGSSGASFVLYSGHTAAFLHAVRKHWAELIEIGPHYSWGPLPSTELWELPTTIQTALAQIGVPLERIRQEFGRTGLEPFAEYLTSA
jgi:hypothetical protein